MADTTDTDPQPDNSDVVELSSAAVSVGGELGDKEMETSVEVEVKAEETRSPRGLRFWLVFVALCCSLLLSALDLVSNRYRWSSSCHTELYHFFIRVVLELRRLQ